MQQKKFFSFVFILMGNEIARRYFAKEIKTKYNGGKNFFIGY